MSFPKKEIFSAEEQQLGEYSRALSHPARQFIMFQIFLREEMSVHEIERIVPLSQAAVSDHLNTLRRIGMIEVECRGRYNYYRLNNSRLFDAAERFVEFFQKILQTSGQLKDSQVELNASGT